MYVRAILNCGVEEEIRRNTVISISRIMHGAVGRLIKQSMHRLYRHRTKIQRGHSLVMYSWGLGNTVAKERLG